MVQGASTNSGSVITPGNINLSFQGSNPVSDIPPLKVNNFALFVQEKGNQVRTLGYSFAENAFIGQDITTTANHLLKFNTISRWCYQEVPYSCIWMIRDDGKMIALTFNPEQQIAAWHWHETQGTYEAVCCITENGLDVVYMVVNRTIGGVNRRCIEMMMPRQVADPVDNFFVDCG